MVMPAPDRLEQQRLHETILSLVIAVLEELEALLREAAGAYRALETEEHEES